MSLEKLNPVLGVEVMVLSIYNIDKKDLIRFCKENFIESGGTVEKLRKRLVKFYKTRVEDTSLHRDLSTRA